MELSGKDASFISYLSRFLHAYGNEVLLGKKKLSLTSSVLCMLNKLYIDPAININNETSNDIQLKENWNFLLNVINNVIALKITHCVETVQGGIDLSMFKSLSMLELKKIPIHLLLGLNKLCSQLETFVCSCSISSLHELLGSKTNDSTWTAMKQLNLSHNYLENLEDTIKLFPNLQVLDISHNRLVNADGLTFLIELRAANLGYNNLSKIPAFSNESYSCLEELSLRNNNLEDLNGLENIRHIRDLDLSYNCLSDHSVLSPIENLPYLKILKLMGNPFSVQRFHRILTAKHFHPNVLVGGVILDGRKLTKTEIGKVTRIRSIIVQPTYHDNANRIQMNSPLEEINVSCSENLNVSPIIYYPPSVDDATVVTRTFQKDDTESITSVSSDNIRKRTSKSKMKRKKEKEIIISDCGNSQHDLNFNSSKNQEECKAQELKATLAARREHLGQEWLVSAYSSSLPTENVLTARPLTDRSRSLKKLSEQQDALHSHNLDDNTVNLDFTNNGANKLIEIEKSERNDYSETDKAVEKATKKISVTSDGIEVICSDHVHQGEIISDDSSFCKSCMQLEQEDSGDDINFQNSENAYDIKYGIVEEDVENPESNIFLVEKKTGGADATTTIFISIGEKYLNEKDVLSTDLLDSLDLSVLETAEIIEKNTVKLEFKIFKVNKRERIYYAENEVAAKEILSLLLPHADARNLKSIVKNALKCLKCDAQFTRNILNQRFLSDNFHPLARILLAGNNSSKAEFEEKDTCPVCESLMIVEDNDCPITATLLQKTNYSPAVISGYLFVPQDTSNASTEFPPNLLLTFKHPPKIKRDTIAFVPNKVTVGSAYLEDSVNSDSDDSSVCTALEYTSQELAENYLSTNSLDLTQTNLNCRANQIPCVTETVDCMQVYRHGENEQANLPETDDDKEISLFSKPVQTAQSEDVIDTEEITYDIFTNINHTLKLYIEMKLFDANEELEAAAEAKIISHSTTIKNEGMLLLSTKKIHFMKLARNCSDEPEKNVTPLEAVGLKQINNVLIFIGNQGVSFIWGTEKNRSEFKACYTCLFRDADYCCSFITYFGDFIKQRVPSFPVISSPSDDNLTQVTQEVLLAEIQNDKCLTSDISTEMLVFLLVQWYQLGASQKQNETLAVILTSTDICIAEMIFTKVNSKLSKFTKPIERYIPIARQKVTNLVGVHPHFDLCQVGFHFLDEDSNKELCWVIVTETRQALYLLINTLKEPWQESFGVEMKLDEHKDCICCT